MFTARSNTKQIYFSHTSEAEVGISRAISMAEKKYLRQLNCLRVLDLIGFLLPLYLALASLFVLFSMMTFVVEIEANSNISYILLHFGLPLCLFWLLIAKSNFKLPKPKLWLSLDNLEAVELTGALGVQTVSTLLGEPDIWQLNKTTIDLPEHWEKYLPTLYPDETKQPVLKIWAVKRKDATGKIFSYTITNPRTLTRSKIVFHDKNNNAISIGPFSIEQDVRSQIPFTRGNFTWLGLSISLAIIAFLMSIYCSILKEDNNRLVTELDHKIAVSEKT